MWPPALQFPTTQIKLEIMALDGVPFDIDTAPLTTVRPETPLRLVLQTRGSIRTMLARKSASPWNAHERTQVRATESQWDPLTRRVSFHFECGEFGRKKAASEDAVIDTWPPKILLAFDRSLTGGNLLTRTPGGYYGGEPDIILCQVSVVPMSVPL